VLSNKAQFKTTQVNFEAGIGLLFELLFFYSFMFVFVFLFFYFFISFFFNLKKIY